jgi:hypothetical protein
MFVEFLSGSLSKRTGSICFFEIIKYGDIDPQAVIAHGLGTYIIRIEGRTVTATAFGGLD